MNFYLENKGTNFRDPILTIMFFSRLLSFWFTTVARFLLFSNAQSTECILANTGSLLYATCPYYVLSGWNVQINLRSKLNLMSDRYVHVSFKRGVIGTENGSLFA